MVHSIIPLITLLIILESIIFVVKFPIIFQKLNHYKLQEQIHQQYLRLIRMDQIHSKFNVMT